MSAAVEMEGEELAATKLRLRESMEEYAVKVFLMQRCLWWKYLAVHVRWATPLLDIIAAREGIDFANLAWEINPPSNWPERTLMPGRPGWGRRVFDYSTLSFTRRHMTAGIVLRRPGWPQRLIGVRVVGDGLEVTASMGELKLETLGQRARVNLGMEVAETVAVRATGCPVSELIDHPWFANTFWPIVDAEVGDGRTLVTFDTGRSAWRLPWPIEI